MSNFIMLQKFFMVFLFFVIKLFCSRGSTFSIKKNRNFCEKIVKIFKLKKIFRTKLEKKLKNVKML